MIRQRPTIIYFLLIGLVCFVVGFLSVLLPNRLDQNTPTSFPETPTPATNSQPTDQRSIAFIGVDSLDGAPSRLVSLWLATIQPGENVIHLTGVPINYWADERGNTAADIFRLPEPNQIDPGFLSLITRIAPGNLIAYVILDEVAFAGLIDYLGGARLNNDVLDGKSAIAVLGMLYDQPEAGLTMQQTMLESLISQASMLGRTPELTPLIEFIPEHAYTSLPPAELATITVPLLPISDAQIEFQLLPVDHRSHYH